MLFSSMWFVWVFLPFVLVGNFILSKLPYKKKATKYKAQNLFLLICSCLFYAWGGLYYFAVMAATIVINYFGVILFDRFRENPAKKKFFFVLTLVLNLAVMFYLKYFNFFVGMIEALANRQFGLQSVVLPIGISFYVFQSMSYVIDAYRGTVKVQRNFFDLALYVTLFPQLIAGPIVRYLDVENALANREETSVKVALGIKRFCYGLAKKVLIADTVAKVVDEVFARDAATLGANVAWLGILLYALQIYYDFSGYSDMAIGLGHMLGFEFRENFNYPYTSFSVQEFWRRWHISLSSWFKEYVYIPLGGNRKGAGRTYLNLFIVFLLTGLWHGANYTFLIWGIYYGVFLILERLFLGRLLQKNPVKILNVIYTLLVVLVGWVLFRSPNIEYAWTYLGQMFSFRSNAVTALNFGSMSMQVVLAAVAGILFSGLVQRPLAGPWEKVRGKTVVYWVDFAVQILLLIACIFSLTCSTYHPFIYFQF